MNMGGVGSTEATIKIKHCRRGTLSNGKPLVTGFGPKVAHGQTAVAWREGKITAKAQPEPTRWSDRVCVFVVALVRSTRPVVVRGTLRSWTVSGHALARPHVCLCSRPGHAVVRVLASPACPEHAAPESISSTGDCVVRQHP